MSVLSSNYHKRYPKIPNIKITSQILRDDLMYWQSQSAEIDTAYDEDLITSKEITTRLCHTATLINTAAIAISTVKVKRAADEESRHRHSPCSASNTVAAAPPPHFRPRSVQQSFFLVNQDLQNRTTVTATITRESGPSVSSVDASTMVSTSELKLEKKGEEDRVCSKCVELQARQAQLEGTISALVARLEMKNGGKRKG